MNIRFLICASLITCLLSIYFYQQSPALISHSDSYPKLKLLEQNVDIIINELPPFDESNIRFSRKQNEWGVNLIKLISDMKNAQWIKSWEYGWFNYPLIYNGKPIADSHVHCPETINMLMSIGNIKLAGFSLLKANCKIDKHQDDTELSVNMKLTGDGGEITVYDSINRSQTETLTKGKVIVFNGTNVHEVDNNGNNNRVILFLDFS
jgi:hypothetical protein